MDWILFGNLWEIWATPVQIKALGIIGYSWKWYFFCPPGVVGWHISDPVLLLSQCPHMIFQKSLSTSHWCLAYLEGFLHRHRARSSANLVLPPPVIQMAEAPNCHPQSSPSNCFCWKSVHSMNIQLNPHWPRGICILHRPGLEALGQRSPWSCNCHCHIYLVSSWRYASRLLPLQQGGHYIWFWTSLPFSTRQG